MGDVRWIFLKCCHCFIFVYIVYLIHEYNVYFTKYTTNWYYLCTILIFYYLIYDFINKIFIKNVFNIIIDVLEIFLYYCNPYILDSIDYLFINLKLYKIIRLILYIINGICRHFR